MSSFHLRNLGLFENDHFSSTLPFELNFVLAKYFWWASWTLAQYKTRYSTENTVQGQPESSTWPLGSTWPNQSFKCRCGWFPFFPPNLGIPSLWGFVTGRNKHWLNSKYKKVISQSLYKFSPICFPNWLIDLFWIDNQYISAQRFFHTWLKKIFHRYMGQQNFSQHLIWES